MSTVFQQQESLVLAALASRKFALCSAPLCQALCTGPLVHLGLKVLPRPFAQAAQNLVYNDNPSVVPAEAKAEALWEGSMPEAQGRKATFV